MSVSRRYHVGNLSVQNRSYTDCRDEPRQMGEVLQADLEMRHRARADEFLVHVGLEGQALEVDVVAQRDEPLAALVRSIIGILHRGQYPEHGLVLGHEKFARQPKVADAARGKAG